MQVHVTTRGRIVLPASLCRQLGIKPGTRIHVQTDESNHSIILTPITRAYVDSIRGKYRGTPLMRALVAEKKRA